MELAQPIERDTEPASAAFQWLRTGEEALTRMLREIDGAQSSIRLETYIFHAGPVAEQFREALVLACQRGVKVHVLIDALGSISLATAFWEPLTRFDGKFAWFNPISLKRLSYRNHRKMLVIDDQVAFIGGFNIAEEYKGDGIKSGWRDLGLRITGPIVKELAESFDAFYAKADLKPKRLQRLRKAATKVAEGQNWKLVMSGPGRHHGEIRRTLGRDLAAATSVRIICAYFLPTWRLRKELLRVCNRGGRVQLILAGKSDVMLSQLASRHLYRQLMRSGVEIYEYQPQILHAKLFVFDDIVYVGSANLDVRSLRINYELIVRIKETKLAAEAAEIFDKDLQYCRHIDLETWRRSRTLWGKLKENWAYFVLARVDPYFAGKQMRSLR
jgi:cardiolipin synthase A/B